MGLVEAVTIKNLKNKKFGSKDFTYIKSRQHPNPIKILVMLDISLP